MMPEERAALVAWQLLAPGASIGRFKGQLDQQAHPEWNRAVRLISDAIRDAEVEVREAVREAIEGYREREYSLEADLAKEADAERSVGDLFGLGDETPLAERLEEYPETSDWVETYDTVQMLFTFVGQKYLRGSLIITSNLAFAEWTEVFGAARLISALLPQWSLAT